MHTRSPAAIIRLEGTFDLPAARLLENSLRRMSPGDRVRVDFRGVRRFHDYGIAVLAQALERSGAAVVRLEGLGLHHVRLLRYFGVGPEFFRPGRERDG
jgi:anti-anti-sigma regulatory factor